MLFTGMNIGRAVRVLRTRAGMTQGDVARRAGWERSYVSELEGGKVKNPSFDTVIRFVQAVKASCDEFMSLALGGAKEGDTPHINDFIYPGRPIRNTGSGSSGDSNGPSASE